LFFRQEFFRQNLFFKQQALKGGDMKCKQITSTLNWSFIWS
jgi:hypothetical protein